MLAMHFTAMEYETVTTVDHVAVTAMAGDGPCLEPGPSTAL